jgi:hypothetical protein
LAVRAGEDLAESAFVDWVAHDKAVVYHVGDLELLALENEVNILAQG